MYLSTARRSALVIHPFLKSAAMQVDQIDELSIFKVVSIRRATLCQEDFSIELKPHAIELFTGQRCSIWPIVVFCSTSNQTPFDRFRQLPVYHQLYLEKSIKRFMKRKYHGDAARYSLRESVNEYIRLREINEREKIHQAPAEWKSLAYWNELRPLSYYVAAKRAQREMRRNQGFCVRFPSADHRLSWYLHSLAWRELIRMALIYRYGDALPHIRRNASAMYNSYGRQNRLPTELTLLERFEWYLAMVEANGTTTAVHQKQRTVRHATRYASSVKAAIKPFIMDWDTFYLVQWKKCAQDFWSLIARIPSDEQMPRQMLCAKVFMDVLSIVSKDIVAQQQLQISCRDGAQSFG